MEMIKVISSNIVAIGHYDDDLYVEFESGTYVYYNVPKEVFTEMLNAESKGKYMRANIRGQYESMLVQEVSYGTRVNYIMGQQQR